MEKEERETDQLSSVDGELSAEMENAIDEVLTVLCDKRSPRNRKKVSITNRFPTGERVVSFVFARVILRRFLSSCELIVHTETHSSFLLHPKEKTKAVKRALLVHVAVRREEEALTS